MRSKLTADSKRCAAIKDFTLKEKGKLHARFQSPGAEPPFATGTSEEILIVDTERGFVFNDLKTANAGFNNWNKIRHQRH